MAARAGTSARRAPKGSPPDGARARAVIEAVTPSVDGGAFPIKRTAGEPVVVEADVFTDGHDAVAAILRWKRDGERSWREHRMEPLASDRWTASFVAEPVGRAAYSVQAWVDRFGTWRRDLAKKAAAGDELTVDLATGAEIVRAAAARAGRQRAKLQAYAGVFDEGGPGAVAAAQDEELLALMQRFDERADAVESAVHHVTIEPERARFSTWYELFPRSASPEPGRHGTFDDVIARLPAIEEMGFDVLYLPPVHPISRTARKGRNNDPVSRPGDVGSPWAIGSEEGGHTAIHPELGTIEGFDRLVEAARGRGIDVAVDLAFQCSPDHPYVKEHPEWFRWRPDGTVAFAENPPKKYQDIYPLDFTSAAWRELWAELRDVVRFWIDHGVRVFRVDNPHTKPFRFWEWLIGEIKRDHPEVIFLSEAFTRPRVMERLAKVGFSQSYTYFTWRNTKWELEQYCAELTQTPVAEYLRPNFWPNTPDILSEYLQHGGRPAFMTRLVLAATMAASYGIYGPAFELCENTPLAPGKEEYLDSEKYEIRHWDTGRADSLAAFIARVNAIRRAHPALQADRSLRFHGTDNDQIIAYSKTDGDDAILCIVTLDPFHTQSGWTSLDLGALGLPWDRAFQVRDLLTDAVYLWHGANNYVELNPHVVPAHVLSLSGHVRDESDFEYFA